MTGDHLPPFLLIVCRANRARSPLAAAMLQRQADRRLPEPGSVAVLSAGVRAVAGEPALPAVAALASKLELDLSHHRSAAVSMELVRASDLVLTMTESQRAVVGRMAEAGYSKTFTLREFVRLMGRSNVAGLPLRAAAWQAHLARPMIVAPSQPEDVVDPVGGSARLLRRVTHDLGELTEEIARALFP